MNPHAPGQLDSLQLGRVIDNHDPEQRGRVKVGLHALPVEVWASVIAPSAGAGYGVSFVPRVGEIVVIGFVSPDFPLVLGSVWSGFGSVPPEAMTPEHHYVIRTPAGSVFRFDDENGPLIEMQTPSGHRITVTEGGGGSVNVSLGGQSITMTPSEITIRSGANVTIEGSKVTINAAMLEVNAGMSRFSGVVQADTVITNAVVSSSYSPGAGNIW